MQTLAHTWILRELIRRCPALQNDGADIFACNVAPDFLPSHPDITAAMTHQIPRFNHVPEQYRKAHYVQLHLLVDDFAHHGHIRQEAARTFNVHAQGYAYVMGRPLVEPIMEYCKTRGIAMEYHEAVYYSHMIIELSMDICLRGSDEGKELVTLFGQGIAQASKGSFPEFTEVLSWLYEDEDIDGEMIRWALRRVTEFYETDSLILSADAHDRIQYYTENMGGIKAADDRQSYEEMKILVEKGLTIIGDPTDYLREVVVGALLESPYCREITGPL
jgi:hypothetical protein